MSTHTSYVGITCITQGCESASPLSDISACLHSTLSAGEVMPFTGWFYYSNGRALSRRHRASSPDVPVQQCRYNGVHWHLLEAALFSSAACFSCWHKQHYVKKNKMKINKRCLERNSIRLQ